MIARYLARNVLTLRRSRGLTQAALAKISGIPRSTVTYIESGDGNPSLKILCKISSALQVNIESLLARPRSEIELIPAREIEREVRGGGSAHLFKLLPDPIPGMEIDRMEIEPGGKLPGLPHLAFTKEYLTCVEGEVLVHVAGERFRVEKGDVLTFPGNQSHGYQNPGSRRAICISVVALNTGNTG